MEADRSGYTRLIQEAGRYTKAEAEAILKIRGEEGAIPLSVVMDGAVLKIRGKLAPGFHDEVPDRNGGQRFLVIADAVIEELKGRKGMWPDDLDNDEVTLNEIRAAIARIVAGA